MRNSEKFNPKPLSRAELKQIKGGATPACEAAWAACNPDCAAGQEVGYPIFAQCIDNAHVIPCSPLAGWDTICGA